MTRKITDWPYSGEDGMSKNRLNNKNVWVECTENHYWDQLECLPPIRQKQGAFMVGECYGWDETLGDLYACFVEITFHGEEFPRYFGQIKPIKKFDPVLFKMEIIDQVFGVK